MENSNNTVDIITNVVKISNEVFSKEVFDIKRNDPETTYLDIIMDLLEKYEFDITNIQTLLTPSLFAELEKEAEYLKLIKKRNRLNLLLL